MKNILAPLLYKDIERCPFVPKDSSYEEWNKENKIRIEKILSVRSTLMEVQQKVCELLNEENKGFETELLTQLSKWLDSQDELHTKIEDNNDGTYRIVKKHESTMRGIPANLGDI